jgi:hypothetical protein
MHPAVAAFSRSRWLYVAVSLLLLAPCYWQPQIEAGDLGSHIYNAWLAQLIGSGRARGLAVVWQSTNVLFDLMLSGLFKLAGPDFAQRISVSACVLVFFWGAFACARAVSGRLPWPLAPFIAMLAYGWVYHMGFFNFYLSMALCCWALALLWQRRRLPAAGAAAILALAFLAHALPVAWALGMAAYVALADRLSPKSRTYLFGGSLLAMVVLHVALSGMMITRWLPEQIKWTTGLDQVWVFSAKYKLVLLALSILLGKMLLHLVRQTGLRQVVSGMPFQCFLLSAAGVFILPEVILPPGYLHALGFIAERMSMGAAICVCALLSSALASRFDRYAMVFVALVFFGFLYHDERALNGFEQTMQDSVGHLPPGQRVISAITQDPNDTDLRVNGVSHMIDRVCVGHCYSYANYEPPTAQFRVRIQSPNPYLLDFKDSYLMQMDAYAVQARDLPLYQVDLDAGRMVIKSLPEGFRCQSTAWNVLTVF